MKRPNINIFVFTMTLSSLMMSCSREIHEIPASTLGNNGHGNESQALTLKCDPHQELPESLSKTCLGPLVDQSTDYKNAKKFTPSYKLFREEAEKERWIHLPPGSKIDNSNPDNWIFPQGTQFLKTFSINGKKIESRYFEKISKGFGVSSWRYSLYLWRADQSGADLTSDGEPPRSDVEYEITSHKEDYAPAKVTQCLGCHEGNKDFILGFSSLQLSNENKGFNLKTLNDEGWLAQEVLSEDRIRGRTPLETQALGYLYANCAHCHNPEGLCAQAGFNLKHQFSQDENASEVAVATTVGQSKPWVVPGEPEKSSIYILLSVGAMPFTPYAPHKKIDKAGVELIKEWIARMPKN